MVCNIPVCFYKDMVFINKDELKNYNVCAPHEFNPAILILPEFVQ